MHENDKHINWREIAGRLAAFLIRTVEEPSHLLAFILSVVLGYLASIGAAVVRPDHAAAARTLAIIAAFCTFDGHRRLRYQFDVARPTQNKILILLLILVFAVPSIFFACLGIYSGNSGEVARRFLAVEYARYGSRQIDILARRKAQLINSAATVEDALLKRTAERSAERAADRAAGRPSPLTAEDRQIKVNLDRVRAWRKNAMDAAIPSSVMNTSEGEHQIADALNRLNTTASDSAGGTPLPPIALETWIPPRVDLFSSFISEFRAGAATATVPLAISIFLEGLPLSVLLLTVKKTPLDRRIQQSTDWLRRVGNAHRVPLEPERIAIRLEPLNKRAWITLDLRPNFKLEDIEEPIAAVTAPYTNGYAVLGYYHPDGKVIDFDQPLQLQLRGEELVIEYVRVDNSEKETAPHD